MLKILSHKRHGPKRFFRPRHVLAISLLIVSYFPSLAAAEQKEICIYRATDGTIKQTNSRDAVPANQRKDAKCFNGIKGEAEDPKPTKDKASASEKGQKGTAPIIPGSQLASPDEMTIQGNKRIEELSTPLGLVWLSWPRKVESLFGRTPLRAVTDAASTVSRALKNNAFPSSIQKLSVPWKIVFLDGALPIDQVPLALITNCHPGWMTPPANIYIVADRIAEGCGGRRSETSVADSTLTQVLLHEIGHAVEYYLLQESIRIDRMRAEGFATWFETYAAQYSSVVSKQEIEREIGFAAKRSYKASPDNFVFGGTGEDYARASLYFSAIVKARGINGLVETYTVMRESNLNIYFAAAKAISWPRDRLEREAKALVSSR